MNTTTIVLLVILVILIAALVALYFMGKRMEKQQDEQRAQIEATKQPVTMLVIDKKRLRIKEAGLPDQVYQTTPWYLKRSKLPIVKAKIGPQVLNLVCDDKIFNSVPVKQQVRAMISGMYIVEVKALHGQKLAVEVEKKSRFKKWIDDFQTKTGAKARKK